MPVGCCCGIAGFWSMVLAQRPTANNLTEHAKSAGWRELGSGWQADAPAARQAPKPQLSPVSIRPA